MLRRARRVGGWALGVGLSLGTIRIPIVHAAEPTPTCAQTAEDGQALRARGKLLDAKDHFVACSGPMACPNEVANDCARTLTELVEVIPTIVIDARDKQGHDVADVTVIADGQVIATEIDGKSIAIDPGRHTFVFQRGGERLTETFIAEEGVKARVVRVVFRGDSQTDEAPVRDIAGHSVWPWAVVALGAVTIGAGAAIIVTTPPLPANCEIETKLCTPMSGETTQALDQRREQASQHVSQPRFGIVAIGVGAAIAAGGLLWHFLEPVEPRNPPPPAATTAGRRRSPMRVVPWLGPNAGGVTGATTF
jgi:hypothetical protein